MSDVEPIELGGPDEEVLAAPIRRPAWPWLALAVVAIAGVVLAIRWPADRTTDGRPGAAAPASASARTTPSPSLSVRTAPVVIAPARPAVSAPVEPRLDAPKVACPSGAMCDYVAGRQVDQDRDALAATFPGALMRHSVSYLAQWPLRTVVLSRRLVATDGRGRIVITVRRAAALSGISSSPRRAQIQVVENVPGYLVVVSVRDVAMPDAECVRRATALANNALLLLWPHGVDR